MSNLIIPNDIKEEYLNTWNINKWWKKHPSRFSNDDADHAMDKIYSVFNKEWLSHILDTSGHPFFCHLKGNFPYQLDSLVELGLDIAKFENINGFDLLLQSLKKYDEFESALSVIEAARFFDHKGIQTVAFEKHFMGGDGNQRKADIIVCINNSDVIVEVKAPSSKPHERIEAELSGQLSRSINNKNSKITLSFDNSFWDKFDLRQINPHNPLPRNIVQQISSMANNIILKLKSMTNIERAVIDDVIIEVSDTFDNGVTLPGRYLKEEVKRSFRNRFGKAMKQLGGKPGIIFFSISWIHDVNFPIESLVQSEFESKQCNRANLLCFILYLFSYNILNIKHCFYNQHAKYPTIQKELRTKLHD